MLDRAARHRGAAFIEIMQLCRVFNDDAFDYLTNRETRETNRLFLEQGRPIRFGAGGRKGIVVRNMEPRVVDVEAGEATESELLVHDEKATSPALAALLAALEPPEFPTALGVFRAVERPTYDGSLMNVISETKARRGRGDLRGLFRSETVWQV
jgi:2-oxoglutarate ferredoxin oxidoreductase subunit beta